MVIENNSRGSSCPAVYVPRCIHPAAAHSCISPPRTSTFSLALCKPICCKITLWWHLSLPRLELISCSLACATANAAVPRTVSEMTDLDGSLPAAPLPPPPLRRLPRTRSHARAASTLRGYVNGGRAVTSAPSFSAYAAIDEHHLHVCIAAGPSADSSRC